MERLNNIKKYGVNAEIALAQVFDNDIDNYLTCLNLYANDEQFILIDEYLNDQSYGLAMDAVRSLMYMAQDFGLAKLYILLEELNDDLVQEEYKNVIPQFQVVKEEHQKFLKVLDD